MERVKIGWAKRDISTQEPVAIPGQMYLRISTGVKDPIYTTALCVQSGESNNVIIFCSIDCVALRNSVVDIIKEKVKTKNPQIDAEKIIVNATHNHSSCEVRETDEFSPDGRPIFSGEKYLQFLTDQCADAIIEAWDKRKAGGISFGYGYAVVAHSRRVVYKKDMSKVKPNTVAPNGRAIMYGNTKDELFSHYEAGADHFANLMYTYDEQDNLTGIIINIPCPSQLSEHFTMLSADYWNEVRELVKNKFGENVFVLPQCAAAGDLSPRILHYKEAQQRRMRLKYGVDYDVNDARNMDKIMCERYDIAERIVNAAEEVFSWSKKEIYTHPSVCCISKEIKLKKRLVSDSDIKWCENSIEKQNQIVDNVQDKSSKEYSDALSRYNIFMGRLLSNKKRKCEQENNKKYATKVFLARIGDISFATTQFELYMDYMHRIQARSPFVQTFVIQLAGVENSTYLPTERAVKNRGYSASIFDNQVSPAGGDELVEYIVEGLNSIFHQT